jgi:hypothetical protein
MSNEAQNGNFAKPMLGVVLNETELENDYPVYWDYLYVCDGKVVKSDVQGTIADLKREKEKALLKQKQRSDVHNARGRDRVLLEEEMKRQEELEDRRRAKEATEKFNNALKEDAKKQ